MHNTNEQAVVTDRSEREAYWMPFTANRQFKDNPRLLTEAKGMYYHSADGREILDGTAGLWCVNAGHGRSEIADAVHHQMQRMDYGPSFQMGHPLPYEFANRLIRHTPEGLDHVFFTNSGSESVDTALKIALAYHQVRGEGARQRLIGREKGYHGVGFGGISVGGLGNNRRLFGPLLAGVDHLPHTLNLGHNAFSRGLPGWGAHLAEHLEERVALHGASTIAAVIVEPVAGSAGVILPPQGYLQKLREICDRHGILLIFDEVITGFGRVGGSFAAQRFDVVPDMITSAKGLSNGAIPMGAVFVRKEIYDAFMNGPEEAIELFHGYTYSGHPAACAAGIAALDIYEKEGLFSRATELEACWEDAAHSLAELPHVTDIRNIGLIAGIQFDSIPERFGARGYKIFVDCFERGLMARVTGDTIAFSPPLIIQESQIDRIFTTLADVIRDNA